MNFLRISLIIFANLLSYSSNLEAQFSDNCLDVESSIFPITPTPPNNLEINYTCQNGNLENATPETSINGIIDSCGVFDNPTLWVKVRTDLLGNHLITIIDTDGTWEPIWTVFGSEDGTCDNLIQLTDSQNHYCSNQSEFPDLLITPFLPNVDTYYIAITTNNTLDDPNFQICIASVFIAINCISPNFNSFCENQINYTLVDRSQNLPLDDPLRHGERVTICYDFLYNTKEDTEAEELAGLIPVFGPGWDISQVKWNENKPEGSVFIGSDDDCNVQTQEYMPNWCTYVNQDNVLELCNDICGTCMCNEGLMPGSILPNGYFWLKEGDDNMCLSDCYAGQEFGINSDSIIVQGCFEIRVKDNFCSAGDLSNPNLLTIGLQTVSRGVIGCYDDPLAECLLDPIQYSENFEIDTMDFFLGYVYIGGSIWVDNNVNGIKDDNENDLISIPVNVYDCSNNNILATVLINSAQYSGYIFLIGFTQGGDFDDIEVYMEIDVSVFEQGGVLEGLYEPCDNYVSANVLIDNDNNSFLENGTLRTDCIPINCALDDFQNEYIFDFCLMPRYCENPSNNPLQIQTQCNILENLALDIDNTLTICDISILDGFCGTTLDEPFQTPGTSCYQDTLIKTNWFAFIPGISNLTIEIIPKGCIPDSSGLVGMQAAVYSNCSFTEELWCGECTSGVLALDLEWTPGKIHYVVYSGCGGARCDFEFNIDCHEEECFYLLPEVENISIEGCTDICNGETYKLKVNDYSDDIFLSINWSIGLINGSEMYEFLTIGNQLNYTFVDGSGDYVVCVEVFNTCLNQQYCDTITVNEKTIINYPSFELCSGEVGQPDPIEFQGLDYLWQGNITAPNNITSDIQSVIIEEEVQDSCCNYIQSVELLVLPDSEIYFDTVYVTSSNLPFDYNGFQITQPGSAFLTLEDANINGCDSLINLTVILSTGTKDLLDRKYLFPNPTINLVLIPSDYQGSNFSLHDSSSRLIQNGVLGEYLLVDYLATGVYFLKVLNTEGGFEIFKVLKL